MDYAKKVDEEIYDLENQKNINIEGVKQLKLEIEKAFQNQNEIIEGQIENVKEYRNVTSDVILKSNDHHNTLTDIQSEMEELKIWKEKITGELLEDEEPTEIKTEDFESTEFEVDYEDIKMEFEDEVTETEIEQPNPDTGLEEESKNIITAAQMNKSIRLKWYKVSTKFMPEKYRLQYVHTDADARNEKRIFEWYEECKAIGIIPEEFQLIPEDTEQENKKQQKQWKSRKTKENKGNQGKQNLK